MTDTIIRYILSRLKSILFFLLGTRLMHSTHKLYKTIVAKKIFVLQLIS